MKTTEFELAPSPLLKLSPTTSRYSMEPFTSLTPGGDDGDDYEDNDWSDIDDEDFEDWAEDKEEAHQSEIDNDIFDPEDDDHLPEDEDF